MEFTWVLRFGTWSLNFRRGDGDEDFGGLLTVIDDLMRKGGVEVEGFLRLKVVLLVLELDLDMPVKDPHEFFHTALVMLLLRLASALEGQKERGDLLLRAFLREYFHMDIFGVMRGRSRFLGLVTNLLVAAIDSGIKLREPDAERFGDLLVGFDRPDHGAGLDAGKGGLGDARLLRDLDQSETLVLAKCSNALS